MTENPTVREMADGWQSRGYLDDSGRAALESWLKDRREETPDPVYIRILIGIAAWAAAVCFIAFLSLLRLVDPDEPSMLLWGLLFLAGAVILRRVGRRVFPVQLALAFGSAGNALVVAWGGFEYHHSLGAVGSLALFQALVCLAMYWPYRETVFRFLSPLIALAFATTWVLNENDLGFLLHVLIGLETLGVGLILAGGRGGRPMVPLGYACAAAGPASIILFSVVPGLHIPVWPTSALVSLGVIWLFTWAAGGADRARHEWLAIAAAATVLLAVFTTPGIPAALGILTLGYARRDRPLLALGFLFLPVFIVVYYYSLNVDLAYKSYVLAGSGLVLLAARFVIGRRPWAGKVAS